jgi:hypothetical protein
MVRIVKWAVIALGGSLIAALGVWSALAIAVQVDEERSMEPEHRLLLRARP